ncbi:hypothetical protein GBAR_LOCUS20874 [Geodia barretti]|uniref:Uncharacterized protein n=1 Tax=Geodia barretti TaxID=519541 RepID=A0AA35SWD3_GEOBA|nr:hypothetical protein GBAR_LOCUS20874 [Geodia barretti]
MQLKFITHGDTHTTQSTHFPLLELSVATKEMRAGDGNTGQNKTGKNYDYDDKCNSVNSFLFSQFCYFVLFLQ